MLTDDDPLRRQIYLAMKPRSTEALLRIWHANNRAEWSNETFEVIHEILQERMQQVPEQGARQAAEPQPAIQAGLVTAAPALALPGQPERGGAPPTAPAPDVEATSAPPAAPDLYHEPDWVMDLGGTARTLSWVVVGLGGLLLLGYTVLLLPVLRVNLLSGLLVLLATWSVVAILGGLSFILLQAAAQVLYILMDIEENTRRRG
jgi:hypothetical protein